jgi:hypothetical protein
MHRLAIATAFAIVCATGFAVVACHPSSSGAPAPSTPAPKPAAAARTSVIDRLVGVWAGTAEGTPFGDIPFALAFDRDADGSIHARTDDGKGTYLDFRFIERDGKWLLVEEGAIPRLGTQTHTLAPAEHEQRWSDKDIDVVLAIANDRLVMTTTLRGAPHATFRLQRKTGVEGEQIRAQLAKQASHPAVAE